MHKTARGNFRRHRKKGPSISENQQILSKTTRGFSIDHEGETWVGDFSEAPETQTGFQQMAA